jgi:TPR repeat protein
MFSRVCSMSLLRGEMVFPELPEGVRARLCVEWSARAAAAGILPAQYQLGCFCESGYAGLPVDHARAASWFAKAARKGHVASLLNLV